MLEAFGTVVGIDGDWAVVRSQRPASCGACAADGACTGSQCSAPTMRLANSLGARPGDRVVFAIAEGGLLRAATRAYLIPLLAGIVSAGLAALAVPHAADLAAGGAFAVGVGAGLLSLRATGGARRGVDAQAVLVRRLPPSD